MKNALKQKCAKSYFNNLSVPKIKRYVHIQGTNNPKHHSVATAKLAIFTDMLWESGFKFDVEQLFTS